MHLTLCEMANESILQKLAYPFVFTQMAISYCREIMTWKSTGLNLALPPEHGILGLDPDSETSEDQFVYRGTI